MRKQGRKWAERSMFMKAGKIFAVLLTAAFVMAQIPAAVFADDSADKDLSKYEVIATDLQDGQWRIFTDTNNNITLNVEVRQGDYVLPAENYTLHIEMESFDEKDRQVFTPVENGKITLGEDGRATVIAYAEPAEGSGFYGQTDRETYFDFFYKYSMLGCEVVFPGENRREDIITPMSELFSFIEGAAIPEPVVSLNGEILEAGNDYTIRYVEGYFEKNHIKNEDGEFDIYWVKARDGGKTYSTLPAGKGVYQCLINGLGKYVGEYGQTNIQIRDADKMKVSASAKTVKYSKVKKKAQTVAPLKVSNATGYVTYSGKGTDSKSKKALKINTKTGKVSVKKGTKKGTYRMKVTVSASGDEKTVTKTISIKVK